MEEAEQSAYLHYPFEQRAFLKCDLVPDIEVLQLLHKEFYFHKVL